MDQYQQEHPQITRFKLRVQASEKARAILKKCKPPEPTLGEIAKLFFFALIKKIGYFCIKKPTKRVKKNANRNG
jgi:DNA-directed RNA polymerase subunit L